MQLFPSPGTVVHVERYHLRVLRNFSRHTQGIALSVRQPNGCVRVLTVTVMHFSLVLPKSARSRNSRRLLYYIWTCCLSSFNV